MHSRFFQYLGIWCFVFFSPLQASWSQPVDVSLPLQNIYEPHVAVDAAGNATAVWIGRDGSAYSVQASTKPVGGTWQTTPDIISQTGQEYSLVQIAVNPDGDAIAIWVESNGTNLLIRSSTKPFGGDWQETPDTVLQYGLNTFSIQIVMDHLGNATAVWDVFDGNAYVIQASTKLVGGPWQTIPNTISGPGVGAPQIAVDSSGNVTAVWVRFDGNNYVVEASTKLFGGDWQETPNILSQSGENSINPQIAVDAAGNATVVWLRYDVVQASTKPFGGTWQETPNTLSQAGQFADTPQIVADSSGNVTAVWESVGENNRDIRTSTKLFGGVWQEPPDILPQSGPRAYSPQIAVDSDGNLTVVWEEDFNSIKSSSKLFGDSWQSTPETIVQSERRLGSPQLAVDPFGNATVIWVAGSGSNFIVQSSTRSFTPSITNISPNIGSSAGGTSVTIIGTNFIDVLNVYFGSTSAAGFTVVSPRAIIAIAPPGSVGTVDVTVATLSGTSSTSAQDQYTYQSQQPLPPKKCTGYVKKRKSEHKHKYLLTARWSPSPSPQITKYRVYKRSKVVDTIHPGSTLIFKTHLLWKSSTKKFSIAAVNSDNVESTHKKLKVHH